MRRWLIVLLLGTFLAAAGAVAFARLSSAKAQSDFSLAQAEARISQLEAEVRALQKQLDERKGEEAQVPAGRGR